MRRAVPVILLLTSGFIVFLTKCFIVYNIEYVGHADASAYAEMADSLIHGRGFEVDYISFYFIKYPRIQRPEDHWPPLYSIFIAPFFLLLGKSAFSAKLPSIIISCFFLPLSTYLLTWQNVRNRVASLCAGITVLLSPAFYEWSLHCLSDVTYAWVVVAFALFVVKSAENAYYHYLAGFFAGLSYYAKGSGLLLIPCYFIYSFIVSFNQMPLKPLFKRLINALINKHLLLGLLVAFLVLLPWFIRNYVHFRDPLFSTQRFAAGYGGYIDWEIGTYDLYWGEKPPPSYLDKLANGIGYVAQMSWRYFKSNLWWTFIDIYSQWGKFSNRAFLTYFVCLPAIPGMLVLWGNKKRHITWLLTVFLLGFLSIGWFPIDRMILPITPLMIAMSWGTYYVVLCFIFKYLNWLIALVLDRLLKPMFKEIGLFKLREDVKAFIDKVKEALLDPRLSASFVLLVFLSPVAILSFESIEHDKKNRGYPFREADQEWMDMGKWLKDNAPPDSITMTRNPWELHFYSEQPAVQIPRTTLEKTIEVMRFYDVSYIIPQLDIRPSLEPLVSGKVMGLELVYDNKKLKLYKVHHEVLGKKRDDKSNERR